LPYDDRVYSEGLCNLRYRNQTTLLYS